MLNKCATFQISVIACMDFCVKNVKMAARLLLRRGFKCKILGEIKKNELFSLILWQLKIKFVTLQSVWCVCTRCCKINKIK